MTADPSRRRQRPEPPPRAPAPVRRVRLIDAVRSGALPLGVSLAAPARPR